MADKRFIDFDAALAEHEEQPVVVRYLGRDWQLFSSLPAKPVMRLLRLEAEGRDGDALSQAEMVTFMTELVPADALDAAVAGYAALLAEAGPAASEQLPTATRF